MIRHHNNERLLYCKYSRDVLCISVGAAGLVVSMLAFCTGDLDSSSGPSTVKIITVPQAAEDHA